MPLHKGAKPGSKEFGENIATEEKAGKPAKQAEAIAYSTAKDAELSSKELFNLYRDFHDKIGRTKDGKKASEYSQQAEKYKKLYQEAKRNENGSKKDAAVPLISARDAARSLLPAERKMDAAVARADALARKDASGKVAEFMRWARKNADDAHEYHWTDIQQRWDMTEAEAKEARATFEQYQRTGSKKDAAAGQPETREEMEEKLEGLKKRRDNINAEEREGRLGDVEKEITETEEKLKLASAVEQDQGKLQHDGKPPAKTKTKKTDGSKLDSIMSRVDHLIKQTDNRSER
jgi:hypothetical protein